MLADETVKLIFTIVSTCFTLILTYVAAIVTSTYKKQQSHGIEIGLIRVNIQAIEDKVGRLHEWRNKLQEEEVQHYKDELKRYREKEDKGDI